MKEIIQHKLILNRSTTTKIPLPIILANFGSFQFWQLGAARVHRKANIFFLQCEISFYS